MGDDKDKKPAPAPKAAKAKGGKKPHKNHTLGKKYEHYKVSGHSIQRDKSCPRCGVGIFLAVHKDRMHCGKCNYTEFIKK